MTTEAPPKREGAAKPNIRAIITDWPYVALVLGAFFIFWALFFPYFCLQPFCNSKGMDPTLAFYPLAIMNAAAVPGRTLPNLLADYYGQFNAMTILSTCTGVLIFALLGVNSTPSVIVFAILYGFCSGAFSSFCPPALAILANNVSEIGIRMRLRFFLVGLANLTGTPIDGALLGDAYTWWKSIVFSGTSVLLGAAFIIASRQMMFKRKGTHFV